MESNLDSKNSDLTICSIESNSFIRYGRKIESLPFEQISKFMDTCDVPEEGDIYVASVAEMEDTELCRIAGDGIYGEMPIQIGYCNGNNSMLNGLEYHKGSEILFAVTDLVLLLGHVWDIEDNKYSSNNVEGFFVPSGTAVELYATTLHFAPCKVTDSGYKSVIILPRGTNCELVASNNYESPEDELLFMSNKWLIVHPEAASLVADNAFVGITGENLRVTY